MSAPVLYATAADLVSKLDASLSSELSSLTSDITAALDDASREIDSRLCSRYVTPVPATATRSSDILRAKCVSIAKYYLLGRKLSIPQSLKEDAHTEYIASMDWLAGVAKKTYSLPDASENQVPTPETVLAQGNVMVGGAAKVFGPESDMLRF